LLYAQEASGWRFDTGPSLLLFPDKYRECFEALGERMEDHLDVVRVRSPSRSS
jgi:phytoene dehydrogenase-like protein